MKPNFKVLFDNHKFLWFLSFLFAFMLWFTVVNTIDTSADRSITNVPVSFESSSDRAWRPWGWMWCWISLSWSRWI